VEVSQFQIWVLGAFSLFLAVILGRVAWVALQFLAMGMPDEEPPAEEGK